MYDTETYLIEIKIKLEPNLDGFSPIGEDFKVYIIFHLLAKFAKYHPLLRRFKETGILHMFLIGI